MLNMTYYKDIQKLREQALIYAETISKDDDDILDIEAEHFEELLGNYLLQDPKLFQAFKIDKCWREELEDLLPIEWEEFMDNVVKSQQITV